MRRVRDRVPLDECKRRALAFLSDDPVPASAVAEAIWPGTEWRAAQGAGAAASRVLWALKKDGAARWTSARGRWGWVKA